MFPPLIIIKPCGLCHSSKLLSFRLARNLSGRIPDLPTGQAGALCTLKAPTSGAGMTQTTKLQIMDVLGLCLRFYTASAVNSLMVPVCREDRIIPPAPEGIYDLIHRSRCMCQHVLYKSGIFSSEIIPL